VLRNGIAFIFVVLGALSGLRPGNAAEYIVPDTSRSQSALSSYPHRRRLPRAARLRELQWDGHEKLENMSRGPVAAARYQPGARSMIRPLLIFAACFLGFALVASHVKRQTLEPSVANGASSDITGANSVLQKDHECLRANHHGPVKGDR